MQSYIDLSLLAIIGITVVVLILILISFLISYRHANSLENQIDNLKKALERSLEQQRVQQEQFAEFERREMQYKSKLVFFNERSDTQERAQQLLSDRLQEALEKLKKFDLRIEQQQREIVENNAKTQPIFEATRMLRRGATMEEVVRKTGLMRHEIEMLTAVHGLSSHANDVKAADSAEPKADTALQGEEVMLPENDPSPQSGAAGVQMPHSIEEQQLAAGREAQTQAVAEENKAGTVLEPSEPLAEPEVQTGSEQVSEHQADAEVAESREAELSEDVYIPSQQPVVPPQVEPKPYDSAELVFAQKSEDSVRSAGSATAEGSRVATADEQQIRTEQSSFTELGTDHEDQAFVLEQEALEIRQKLERQAETESEPALPEVTEEVVVQVQPERVISSGHMASLRARSAYGIPERRSSLRRQR